MKRGGAPGSQGPTQKRRMLRRTSVFSLAILGFAAACADPGTKPPEAVPTTLEVSPQSLDFEALFATARLEVTVLDQHGNVMTGVAVSWQSSSFEVARVDQGGLVTAVDNGSAYIVAAAGDAKDSARVAVRQRPHSLRIPPPRRRLIEALADTVRVTAFVLDPNGRPIADASVAWSSSNTSVVTVDQEGLMTSVDNGIATLGATHGTLADSITAEVKQAPASVRLHPSDNPLKFVTIGDTLRFSAVVLDATGHTIPEVPVAWSTSDLAVATINRDGLVTAVGNGSATISARAKSATGSTRVVVDPDPVRIEVTSPSDLIAVGDSVRMTARAFDAGGTLIADAVFTWTSGDLGVATVNPEGWVRGVAKGSVEITATLKGLSGSAGLTVALPDVTGLMAFFEATNGQLWHHSANWGADVPLDEWYGVEVNERGRVRSLTLSENNLVGRIPPEIGKLTELEQLHLEENLIEGPIPPEIGQLKSLEWLGLYGNYLEGPIPPEIGDMEQLQVIDLAYNFLTGSIPVEVIRLPYLWYLGLFANELSGSIPPEIGDFKGLRVLDLCYNKLAGTIPPEIGELKDLEKLLLCGIDQNPEEGNRLSGTIPPEIGNLTNLRLLDLGANRLTGPIPAELGNLENLDSLVLYSNLLTGIPPELGNLANVLYLSLYGNRFTGGIPPELGSLQSLQHMLLGRGYTSGANSLTGTIPPELGELSRLVRLDLGGNEISGTIPPEIGNLRNLTRLELGSNLFAGEIPPELGNLTMLTYLAACPNNLSGPIPREIGQMHSLTTLYLCGNQLSDKLPPAIGGLADLRHMRLDGNKLSGAMPDSMLSLDRLETFLWGNNSGLCAPDTEAFREWLAGLRAHSNIYCESEAMAWVEADIRASGRPGCSVTGVAARSATGRSLWEGRGSALGAPLGLRGRAARARTGAPGTWVVACDAPPVGSPNW